MDRALVRGVQAVVTSAPQYLRVITLAYAGLGGVTALVLMLSLAVMPPVPMLQPVSVEPAQQALSTVLPPTTELFGVPTVPPHPSVAAGPASLVALAMPDLTSADAPTDDGETAPKEPVEQIPRSVVARPSYIHLAAQPITTESAVEDVVDEDQAEDQAPEAGPTDPEPTQTAIVEPAATPVLQIASASAPRALPTPTATLKELKARMDAANQAAIDAAKATAARAKAEADAANQAAIDALKRSAAEAAAPAMADAGLSLRDSAPTQPAAKQARAAADAANQAAIDAANQASIDAAKATAARAKAEADAANQAAIAAAKAAKSPKR